MKWNTQQVAITSGIVWGGAVFVTTLASIFFGGYGKAFLDVIASIYPGFSISLPGSFIGAVYGFFDAYVGVYIVVWIYGKLGK